MHVGTLALDANMLRKQRFLQSWSPPDHLQGRGEQFVFCWTGHYDITAYGLMLPKSDSDRKRCLALLGWIGNVLSQLSHVAHRS
eukprot:480584-Pyramimonas_sp.AAC.1